VTAALRAFLAHWDHEPDALPGAPPLRTALDPGAGAGVWGDVLRAFRPTVRVWGVERRPTPRPPGYERWIEDDFLQVAMDLSNPFDLVLGNPPYRDAERFIERALACVRVGGHVLFLLRLAFLEGQARRDGLYARHPLRWLWVCSKRPSFQPDGKSSPTAYGVYLWQKGFHGEPTIGYLRHD